MEEWHYLRGETTFGPISGVMLHSLIKRGRLQDDTRVRRAGEAEWSTVSQVIPSLPTIPDSPPPEQSANALPFDSSLPGASVVYAPPQSVLAALPSTDLPAALWFGMIFSSTALLLEIACWTLVLIQPFQSAKQEFRWIPSLPRSLMEGSAFETALLASAISIVATAIWQGCAFASLKRLYGDMVRRSIWSGLWWFVPIANLFKPLLCLRDMRHLSRARRDYVDFQVPCGPLLITMEALIVVRVPISIFEVMKVSPHAAAGANLDLAQASNFAIVALAMILLAIVIRNFLQQRTLYSHWRDDEYWKNVDIH